MKQLMLILILVSVSTLSMNANRIITYSYDEAGNRISRSSIDDTITPAGPINPTTRETEENDDTETDN